MRLARPLSAADILAAAQAGKGKTLAFLIPLLERMLRRQQSQNCTNFGSDIAAVIIVPTDILADQHCRTIREFAVHMSGLRVTTVVGGRNIVEDRRELTANPPHIIVATAGRLSALGAPQPRFPQPVLNLRTVTTVVLDEIHQIIDGANQQQSLEKVLEHMGAGKYAIPSPTGRRVCQV